jgi:molybdate transport system substrate-binding protein
MAANGGRSAGAGSRRAAWGVAMAASLLAGVRAPAGEILVSGAVSLREPLAEIASLYEDAHPGVGVDLGFGASSFVAAQVRAGAPIDVVVSADTRILEALARDGWLAADGLVEIATNRLVVLVAREVDERPSRARDLLDPALGRIAVPDGAVPVGRYAREWLRERGLLEPLEPRLVRTEHARATLAAVDLGHVDAAIVYATDARVARSARLAFEVPAEEQPRIVYGAARLRDSREEAAGFLEFLRGSEARRALARAGFGTP